MKGEDYVQHGVEKRMLAGTEGQPAACLNSENERGGGKVNGSW